MKDSVTELMGKKKRKVFHFVGITWLKYYARMLIIMPDITCLHTVTESTLFINGICTGKATRL